MEEEQAIEDIIVQEYPDPNLEPIQIQPPVVFHLEVQNVPQEVATGHGYGIQIEAPTAVQPEHNPPTTITRIDSSTLITWLTRHYTALSVFGIVYPRILMNSNLLHTARNYAVSLLSDQIFTVPQNPGEPKSTRAYTRRGSRLEIRTSEPHIPLYGIYRCDTIIAMGTDIPERISYEELKITSKPPLCNLVFDDNEFNFVDHIHTNKPVSVNSINFIANIHSTLDPTCPLHHNLVATSTRTHHVTELYHLDQVLPLYLVTARSTAGRLLLSHPLIQAAGPAIYTTLHTQAEISNLIELAAIDLPQEVRASLIHQIAVPVIDVFPNDYFEEAINCYPTTTERGIDTFNAYRLSPSILLKMVLKKAATSPQTTVIS